MSLTDEQLAELKVWTTPAGLAYHDSVVPPENRLDVEQAFRVHGDLRLVAADLLEIACNDLRLKTVTDAQGTKRIKVGPIEIEKLARSGVTLESLKADSFCAKAAELRGQTQSGWRPLPSPLAVMRSGSNPLPVFTIPRKV